MKAPFKCLFCGAPSYVDPSDQEAPPDYCHESDHGSDDLIAEYEVAEADVNGNGKEEVERNYEGE